MKLYLRGHNYKYAVEQMLLTLFPEQRPEYPEGKPTGDRMEISLCRTERYSTACCMLHRGDESFRGAARAENSAMGDKLHEDRVCQRLIKNAIYRAALSAGHERPAWGALTGVRPGKLLSGLMEECADEKEALRRFIKEYDVKPERAENCLITARETRKAAASLLPEDICLYIGIPFCPTRCAYCSFVSQSVEKSMKLIPQFLSVLEQEIHTTAETVRKLGLRVVSIYMGGGTPTTLSAKELDRLCGLLEEKFDLSAVREYTVEAGRPDTISEDKLLVLKVHGVNRLSVNPQTMDDRVLELIGRRHSAEDIIKALELVRKCGGFDVNMDLIAGLPGDSAEGFEKTLERVLSLGAENITVHTLSMKKGSRITVEDVPVPDAYQVSKMLDYAGDRLTAEGYAPYYLYRQKFMSGGFENIGWARAGRINLYNICIMEELCSIIALGGGGSTKLVRRDDGRNIRLMAPKYPLEYIKGIDRLCEDKAKIQEFYKNYFK